MTKTTATEIMDADLKGYLDRRSYSGRGMMGERTEAIVGLWEDFLDILPFADCRIEDFRVDSMGKDHYVIY